MCVPARLSAVHVTILHYSVCVPARLTAVHVTILHYSVCVPARLSAVHVTIRHYNVCASKAVRSSCQHSALQCVCASKAVYSSCQHTALQCVSQQGCLQFMSPYCITVCVPARLSAVHVTILHYSVCVPAKLSAVHVKIRHYKFCACKAVRSSYQHSALQCVCASKAARSSCQNSALQCLHLQVCLQFMSTYCITVCVPTRLSAVHVTILHYSVCASKAVCISCHHTALQFVCQQGCLQFMSPYCIKVCGPARMSAVHVIILHYSVCTNKAVCNSCHHTALECVCQQGCMRFMSTYCITVCAPARLSAVHVTILHYSVCASKVVCSSCHHTALQCVCQQGCLQVMSPYCITVCVPTRLQNMSPFCITVCVPAKLSAVHVTILHYSMCANKAACSSFQHTALQCVCQQVCLQFMSPYCISVCANNAVCSSCHHTALQFVCQQRCLQFMSPYCITVCVPTTLSAVHVTILHYSLCVPTRLSSVHVNVLHYSVCASKAVCSSCHHTALQCVCQQGCLQFMSPYCITLYVPTRLSAVHVTILHHSVCASKAVCSSCHHTALQRVCQQGCLQFMSPCCVTGY